MCTAVSVVAKKHYFGRNLDYEYTFGEKITIMPRRFQFEFTNGVKITSHSAIMGVSKVENGYPLFFDAVNEYGVCMAGLNFPHFSHWFKEQEGKVNVASYELIPRILLQCKTAEEAKKLCNGLNITDKPFAENFSPTPLHWIIADKENCITVEQTKSGIKVFDNPLGVLTNSPSFDMQMFNLNNYISLSNKEPENSFSEKIRLLSYSRGMGGVGLPGDNSSASRFVRAGFAVQNSVFKNTEEDCVNQVFHILDSVCQQRGTVKIEEKYEITNYSVCCNSEQGVYYWTTYDNRNISAIDMKRLNLDSDKIITYDLYRCQNIDYVN